MNTSPWTPDQVERALGVTPGGATSGDAAFTAVCTDSRAIEGGELFLALRGERFDAHEFLSEAVAAGACGVVVQKGLAAPLPVNVPVFEVDDTLVALGRLAAFRRKSLGARVVGITGSVGKTTTKDLTRGALSGTRRTHATAGNFNNRIGLPLTVLSAPADTDVLVLEMGTNEPGEIETLTEIASPEVGVVTTVSEVHLEKLGTLDGVYHEKLALLRGLPDDGVAIVSDDPPELADWARAAHRTVRVAGTTDRADADLRAEDLALTTEGRFSFTWQGRDVELRVPGRPTVTSAALALGVADTLGVDVADAIRGVSEVLPGTMRGEVRRVGDLVLLVDCYNASPQSVRAAGRLLEDLDAPGGRVAILGSMLELGDRAAELHSETLSSLRGLAIDRFYLTGAFATAGEGVQDARFRVVPGVDAALAIVPEELHGDEAVLLKGSRGVRLERLLPVLEGRFGSADGGGV